MAVHWDERSEPAPKLWGRWLGTSPERQMQGKLLLAWPQPWRDFSEDTATSRGQLTVQAVQRGEWGGLDATWSRLERREVEGQGQAWSEHVGTTDGEVGAEGAGPGWHAHRGPLCPSSWAMLIPLSLSLCFLRGRGNLESVL